MLIIAIPKSASTSLMKTIGNVYNLQARQESFNDAEIPFDQFKFIWNYHSDMREISSEQAERWTKEKVIYKQHVLPTKNNLLLLKNRKKVILLRKPEDIVLSYRRTQFIGLSKERKEFSRLNSEEDWLAKSAEIGLLGDLYKFKDDWLKQPENNLTIYYEDYISNATLIVNRIAEYWGLPPTTNTIIPDKERYTRESKIETFLKKMLGKVSLK